MKHLENCNIKFNEVKIENTNKHKLFLPVEI